MKKLLTGVAAFIAIASALPALASDVTADRDASNRSVQTTASAQSGATSRGPMAEPKKQACSCSCMRAG